MLEKFFNRIIKRISAPVETPAAAAKAATTKIEPPLSRENPVVTPLSNFRDAFLPAEKQSGDFGNDIRAANEILATAMNDLTRVPLDAHQKADINLVRLIMAPVIDTYQRYQDPGDGTYQVFQLTPKDIKGIERAMPALKAARDYYAGLADPTVGRIGKAVIGTADAADALQKVQGVLTLCDIFAPPMRAPAVTKSPALQLAQS